MSDQILQWLHDTSIGRMARETGWLFPASETVHFIALCFLLGAMLVIDLRLLGVARGIPIRAALRMIPVALVSFVFMLITGIIFFCSNPFNYIINWGFWTKMGLVLVAGLNALWFEVKERRPLLLLPEGADVGTETKVVAALSLACWIGVIVFGRLLPYVSSAVG